MPDDTAAASVRGGHVEIRSDAEDAGQRLDRVLQRHLPELSRTRFKQLILAGEVTSDGAVQRDPALRVRAGQHFRVVLPEPAEPAGQSTVTRPRRRRGSRGGRGRSRKTATAEKTEAPASKTKTKTAARPAAKRTPRSYSR